jgi:hypothetical protein
MTLTILGGSHGHTEKRCVEKRTVAGHSLVSALFPPSRPSSGSDRLGGWSFAAASQIGHGQHPLRCSPCLRTSVSQNGVTLINQSLANIGILIGSECY